jgi:hypothetical protein
MSSQQRISSNWTAFTKKQAALWIWAFFGILGTALFLSGDLRGLFPLLVGTVWGVYARSRGRLLADVVLDCGDFLRVTNNGQQQDIPFAEIVAVTSALGVFRHLSFFKIKQKHGADLYFLPIFSIARKTLIDRAEAASGHAGRRG